MDALRLLEPHLWSAVALGALGIAAWVFTTWLRIRHGYPLDGDANQAIYPAITNEAAERLKLLTTENAQLRAELGAIKDRLASVERIVTDRSFSLEHEIEQLRNSAN